MVAHSSLSNFNNRVALCTKCSAFQNFGYYKFPSSVHGNPAASVWIVGADPRRIDGGLRTGQTPQYWTGSSKRNLRDPIEMHFGETLEELVYMTDAVRCQRPPSTRKIPSEALSKCPPIWLRREILMLRPKSIIALGDDVKTALESCKNEILSCNTTVYYLPHPSPANGRKMKNLYPFGGWMDYRAALVQALKEAFAIKETDGQT